MSDDPWVGSIDPDWGRVVGVTKEEGNVHGHHLWLEDEHGTLRLVRVWIGSMGVNVELVCVIERV